MASLEAFALVELVCLTALSTRAARYVSQNHANAATRQALFLAPALAALLTYVGVPLLLAQRPDWEEKLERFVRDARPVLFLWMLPPLLVHGVFPEHETFLMLSTSALVLGTEATLRTSEALTRGTLRNLASRLRPWLADGLAALFIAAMFAFACFGSIRVHHKFLTSNYDFGLFENLFFTTLHGRHGVAFELPYFAEHAEFLLYVLLPVYRLAPKSETLLVLQAFFVVGAAVPLYLLARRWLGSAWQALALATIYLAYPSVHGAVFYDFHFLPLSAFFVLWAAYFYARRAWLGFWPSVLLAMTCREDVALGIGAIGIGFLLLGRTKRLGAALAVLGTLWFGVVKLVWMERFGSQVFSDYYAELIPRGGLGFESVIQTLVSNPLYTFSRTLTDNKLLLALHLLAPLGFLPVRQARTWPLFLPGLIVVGLSTSRSAISQFQFHYSMHFVPYLFIAAVIALAVRRRAFRGPALAAMSLGALVSAMQFSAFVGKSFRTSFHEVSFDWARADAEREKDFAALAARIPPDASVSTGEYEGPHLARRQAIMTVKAGLGDKEYAIFSTRSLRWGGDVPLKEALRKGTYGALELRGDMAVLKRGASTALNAKALRLLDPHR
jgi:uncharacterized membrane protein